MEGDASRPRGSGRGSRIRCRRISTSSETSPGLNRRPMSPLVERMEKIVVTSEGVVKQSGSGAGGGLARGTFGNTRGLRTDRFDVVQSRVKGALKQGKNGQFIKLLSNYFMLKKGCNWSLSQYRVDFSVEVDSTRFRKKLIRDVKEAIGAYVFDGTMLYTHKALETPLELEAIDNIKNEKIIVSIKFVSKLIPGDHMYMQFYNIILRKCLFGMKLEEIGRHFYDPLAAIKNGQFGLELWPGYVTSMRSHEREVLLCVEITHKVIRLESVWETMKKLQASPGDYRKAVNEALVGSIVLTNYNNRTYHIKDIDWNLTPTSTFLKKGQEISYMDYFRTQYQINIKDQAQPLLVAQPDKKDLHRGEEKIINLIPETCQLTGLTDAMRANFTLMKALAGNLHMVPEKRIEALHKFMGRLLSKPEITAELADWGLEFQNELTQCEGRVMAREGIVFGAGGDNRPEMPNEKADWTMAFRKRQMLTCIPLSNWAILVPQRDAQNVDNLVKLMQQVSRPLGMNIRPPSEIVKLQDIRSGSYLTALDNVLRKGNLELVFVILPNNKLDLYAAVKKRLSADFGIPSQCFLAKNLTNKGLMSIATKVVVQINAKLGGEPWSVQNPLKNLMVVGFDAYRGGAGKKDAIGAIVASINHNLSTYYSTISRHNGLEELGNNLAADMKKCLDAYKTENKGPLPERIIFYRDGVGEGQLNCVYQTELPQLQTSINQFYTAAGVQIPKFTYIVVTKKINTRIFTAQKPDNPPPGTVVDDVITLPERYDFYMITAAARQGTVSPCSYNVLCDSQELGPDKIQKLTYKMCHLYYNWSGTVAVPAPCQYAHKLAFLAGMAIGGAPNEKLATKLHFL